MSTPCYNDTTKTDCPRRARGCAVDCPEWAKYREQKESVYADRKKTMDFYTGVNDISKKRVRENRKKRT